MSFDLKTFTLVHVAISLIGIACGFVVLFGLLKGRPLGRFTALFLASTVLTSVTGFLFPFHGVTPAITVGLISSALLAGAIFARYARHLAGPWRWIYVLTSMIALYLSVFVLIVQLFQKVPSLQALAPTLSEPTFLITQLFNLVVFIVLTTVVVIRFRVAPISAPVATA